MLASVEERELCSGARPLVGWRLFRVRRSENGFVLSAPFGDRQARVATRSGPRPTASGGRGVRRFGRIAQGPVSRNRRRVPAANERPCRGHASLTRRNRGNPLVRRCPSRVPKPPRAHARSQHPNAPLTPAGRPAADGRLCPRTALDGRGDGRAVPQGAQVAGPVLGGERAGVVGPLQPSVSVAEPDATKLSSASGPGSPHTPVGSGPDRVRGRSRRIDRATHPADCSAGTSRPGRPSHRGRRLGRIRSRTGLRS
jgi:hypothetical protein